MYNRRIIFDIDDTISFTTNRDWENAEPNQPLIEKINYLYDNGWEIWLLTARGQLSCDGDSVKAYEKYGRQIEEWMKRHGVKYHALSFEKKLATYYVDDKALTPEQFLDLDIQVIKTGWSGAIVELRDGLIYKTHQNSFNTSIWYSKAKNFFNVPKVHSLIGQTICLEYIENANPVNMDEIINIVSKFRKIKGNEIDFKNYENRIEKHCKVNDIPGFYDIFNYISAIRDYMNKEISFNHGDLSIDNIIVDKHNKHYLIDPIYDDADYSSWLLDISKFLFSLFLKKNSESYSYVMKVITERFQNLNPYHLVALQATHAIRVYKYAPETEKQRILEAYNVFIHTLNS